jgi:putative peptide zinc metalloprotease protein
MLELLRQNVAGTFSDLWYRVGPTRPRLSPHAQVIRQKFGRHTAYIVEDPAGGQFYRLSESAYFFVGLLDGRRTVNDAWEACNAQLGDDAPTQRECVELLSKLQLFGLLTGDLPLAADMIELRRREAAKLRIQQRTGRGVSMTIPLLNPEAWLERWKHIITPLFSRWGALLWLAVVGFALIRVIMRRDALGDSLNNLLDPTNLVWMSVVFIVLRAWHELGHAAACKAMGGRCTEVGLMLVAVVLPFPYCDTSSAWRMPEVWKRVLVSSGGVIFETFLAALAAIAWSFMGREDSGLVRTLLFNTMIISSVTTLAFNLNPLLRYDGYYILSDLTGTPNLAQRSMELIKYLFTKLLYKVGGRPPAVRSRGEFWILLLFGLLSWPYRMLIVFGIVMILWSDQRYLTLGAVIAVVGVAMWFVWPLLKSIGYLLTSPALIGRRTRAVTVTVALFGGIFALIGLIPMPAAGYATGTIEPQVIEPLRPAEDGFIEQVHVRPGERVRKGDPIITLYNGEIMAQLAAARASVEGARVELDASMGSTHTNRVLAESRLRQLELALARAEERAEALIIRAGADGYVVPAVGLGTDMDRLVGGFFTKGSLLGVVASTDRLLVRCIVPDRDEGYIFRGRLGDEIEGVQASVRVRGRAGDEISAVVTRHAPAGSRRIASESLTNRAGGEIVLDPSDPEGGSTVAPHWLVEVEPRLGPDDDISAWRPGLRARVRFGVPPEPLLTQWWRWFRQYVSDRTEA